MKPKKSFAAQHGMTHADWRQWREGFRYFARWLASPPPDGINSEIAARVAEMPNRMLDEILHDVLIAEEARRRVIRALHTPVPPDLAPQSDH